MIERKIRMANKTNKANKVIGKKQVSMIVLALLLAATVFVTVFGITGSHEDGALYYYERWIPAKTGSMPASLTLDRALGGEYTMTYSVANATGDVVKTTEKYLSSMGIYDRDVKLDGENLSVAIPADANANMVRIAMLYNASGITISNISGQSLTMEHFASAKVTTGWSTAPTALTLTITLNDAGKAAMKEYNITNDSFITFSMEALGLSMSMSNGNNTLNSYNPFEVTSDTIAFPVNNTAYQFRSIAAMINGGKMPATLSETTTTEAQATQPSAAVPVVLLWGVFALCAVYMIVVSAKQSPAGIWAELLFVVFIFFMLAEVLYASGYMGYVVYILVLLGMAFIAWTAGVLFANIRKEKNGGRSYRSAIGAAYKAGRKLFYMINAAALLVGFVLAFIPAVELAGFVLMLTVLSNIVLNRLFIPAMLYLLDNAFGSGK